jgi:hypothetical protein
MEIFTPYIVIEHIPGQKVKLTLSKWRKRFNFITYRIYPFILLAIGINAAIFTYKEMSYFSILFFGIGIPILCLMMFIRKYLIYININNDYIDVTRKTITGEDTVKYSINSIKRITCKIRYGRGGGTYYFLETRNDQKAEFLTIPYLDMNKAKTTALIAELESITKLKVALV